MQIAEDFSYFEVHRLLWKYLPKPCCVKAAATFRENQLWSVSQQNQGEWSCGRIHERLPNMILAWMEIQFFFCFFFYYLSVSFSQIQGVLRSSPAPHVKAEMEAFDVTLKPFWSSCVLSTLYGLRLPLCLLPEILCQRIHSENNHEIPL